MLKNKTRYLKRWILSGCTTVAMTHNCSWRHNSSEDGKLSASRLPGRENCSSMGKFWNPWFCCENSWVIRWFLYNSTHYWKKLLMLCWKGRSLFVKQLKQNVVHRKSVVLKEKICKCIESINTSKKPFLFSCSRGHHCVDLGATDHERRK